MESRGEQERELGLFDGPGRGFRRQVHRDAQCLEHVGAARLGGDGAVAVLGHGHPGRCAHQRHRCRDVEGVESVAARAADIEDLPRLTERFGQWHRHRAIAQLGRQSGHLGRSLAADGPGDQEIGPLAQRMRGVSQGVDESGHPLRAQFLAGGHRAGKFAEHGDRLIGPPPPGQPSAGACDRAPMARPCASTRSGRGVRKPGATPRLSPSFIDPVQGRRVGGHPNQQSGTRTSLTVLNPSG